ncbi:MAG TPA: hypothetical protein VFK85_16745 [Anaeromyxobacteraceae bacterium]|nr:hypothetical protein [Anaeromyxobacteraceae bacterium]
MELPVPVCVPVPVPMSVLELEPVDPVEPVPIEPVPVDEPVVDEPLDVPVLSRPDDPIEPWLVTSSRWTFMVSPDPEKLART